MPQAPPLSDPPTDKKPPVGPASIRPVSSSSEKTSGKPVLQSQAAQLKAERPEPDKVAVCTALVPPSRTEAQTGAANPAQSNKEDPAPSAAGMKSRLKHLAEQRKCWNTDGNSFLLFHLHKTSLNLQEVSNRTSGGGGAK